MKFDRPKFVLMYIRNGKKILFPVLTVNQAVALASAIADSDLFNDDVDFNIFELFLYKDGKLGESFETEDGEDFNEYWLNEYWKETGSL